MAQTYPIHPFDITHASREEYTSLNRHINLVRRERLPDDPPLTLDETINELQNLPSFLSLPMWCAWDPGSREIIAEAYLQIMHTGENPHLAEFTITVQPAYRRQGLARQMLQLIAATAQSEKRQVLIAQTYDRIPAGDAFLARLGAARGLEAHINQLRISDLDHQLIDQWVAQGDRLSSEFELGLWDGPYPEDQLPAIAVLFDLTNQQPHGDLQVEDMHMTPEQLRQIDQLVFARGAQRWTFYITEQSTGKFVGYTETTWNPNRPEILSQDMTGVFPEFRNRGLGRWMKAAMLAKVIADRPQVRFVRTGNADSNAAMLKINTELGFRPYMASLLWQVELDKVLAYLAGNR